MNNCHSEKCEPVIVFKILDVVCCYSLLFLLYINIEIG